MRWCQQVLIVVVAIGGVERALAQTPIPELKFVEPTQFDRSAISAAARFHVDCGERLIQVYPFHVVNGDVRQAFSRTLLRELDDPRYQETNVAPGARLDSFAMPGADIVLRAHTSGTASNKCTSTCAWWSWWERRLLSSMSRQAATLPGSK